MPANEGPILVEVVGDIRPGSKSETAAPDSSGKPNLVELIEPNADNPDANLLEVVDTSGQSPKEIWLPIFENLAAKRSQVEQEYVDIGRSRYPKAYVDTIIGRIRSLERQGLRDYQIYRNLIKAFHSDLYTTETENVKEIVHIFNQILNDLFSK